MRRFWVTPGREFEKQFKMQDALRTSETRLNTAQAIAHLGSGEMDLLTNPMTWSDEVYRLLGLMPQESTASCKQFFKAVHPEDRVAVEAAYTNALKQASPRFEIEHRIIRRDTGEIRYIHERGENIKDASGKIVQTIGTLQDITERKWAEAALVQAREEAEAGSRAKSAFLSTMSHEIRTPMNAVLGFSQLALSCAVDEKQKEYLALVQSSGRNLVRLLDDILDLSMIEANKMSLTCVPFSIQSLLEPVFQTFQVEAQTKDLILTINVSPDVPSLLHGDPHRLRQVLFNLIGNTIKFTDKGSVRVGVECERSETVHESMILLRLSVQDTGLGIPVDIQDVIFQPLTQGDGSSTRKYGGSGMGLTIAKRLVELMGGRIWVKSEAGKGSHFFFTALFQMPRDAPVNAANPLLMARQKPQRQGLRILVVDDDSMSSLLAVALVEEMGHTCHAVNTGEAALIALGNNDYDVVPFYAHFISDF